MSSGADQIENVIAGGAILWADAALSEPVPAQHIVPPENETLDPASFPGRLRVLSHGYVHTICAPTAATTGRYLVFGGRADEMAYVGTSAGIALGRLPVYDLSHLLTRAVGQSAATGAPLRKKSALATCNELLYARRGLLRTDQFMALLQQLNALLSDEDELVANRIAVSPISLDGLIEFLAHREPSAHPNISIARDGRFAASWSHGRRAKVTLTFDILGGDWVGVDLGTNPPVRHAGGFVIDSLAGIAQPFRSWIKV